MLLGIIVKNNENRFLVLKRKVGSMVDLGLLSGQISNGDILSGVKQVLNEEIGFDFSEGVEFKPLSEGADEDGEYIILCCEKDFTPEEVENFENYEILWCTFNKIKQLYKAGRLNCDQFGILSKAYSLMVNKVTSNAMKVNHQKLKYQKLNERSNFDIYVENYTDKRLFLRLVHRRKIKPCGRECRKYGLLIAQEFSDHSSFENFPELMNDVEFLLEIARTSRNPAECPIYFYDYVNPHLKTNKDFRLKFLKAIYLNENVYKLEDVITIVEYLGMQKENELILAEIDFKRKIEERLKSIDYQDMIEYDCSGLNKKELRDYKIKANEKKVLCENVRKGLKEILQSFTVGQENKEDEEPTNFYEYLCSQPKNSI